MRYVITIISISSLLVLGCEPRHIKAYTPRHRVYEPDGYAQNETPDDGVSGSLWDNTSPSLFEDLRASRIGDILTVVIDEESKGQGDATTTLGTEAELESGLTNFLGLMAAVVTKYPDMDPSKLVSLMSKSDFAGEGKTSRSGKLEGKIAVRVKQVLPNGDLFVEGHKVILLNEEELHFYVSGVIRSSDVSPDNSVRSSLIADAQVEFSGRGVVTDQQAPGWLHKLVDAYSPI